MCFRSVACFIVLGLGFVQVPADAGSGDGKRAHDQLSFGVNMARRGLWSEALFRFKRAEKSEPGNSRIMNNLAVAYEAVGQFDEALGYYKRALKADSSSREVKRNYSRFVEFYQAFKPDEKSSEKTENAEEENEARQDRADSSAGSQDTTSGEGSG